MTSPRARCGVGSVVQVPFHGRATRAWVLGRDRGRPERILRVRKLVSTARSFDERSLALYRAMSERYVAPLATVIGRAVPPRVASEETARRDAAAAGERSAGAGSVTRRRLPGGPRSAWTALRGGAGRVRRSAGARGRGGRRRRLRRGDARGRERTAIVIVPDADPVPATAAAIVDAFGDDVALFLGATSAPATAPGSRSPPAAIGSWWGRARGVRAARRPRAALRASRGPPAAS